MPGQSAGQYDDYDYDVLVQCAEMSYVVDSVRKTSVKIKKQLWVYISLRYYNSYLVKGLLKNLMFYLFMTNHI